MQAPRLPPVIFGLLLLGACTIAPPINRNAVPDEEPLTGSGAEEPVAATDDVAVRAVLKSLDGKVVNGTGSVRFLSSGTLEFGKQKAPLTLTVFTEYHCTYCRQFDQGLLPQLMQEYVEKGTLKVRVVPFVIQKYPNSESAIQAVLCAGKMGSGATMHSLLMERENKHRSSVIDYAKEVGIEADGFSACLESEETAKLIAKQRSMAKKLGITLVPSFILDGEIRTGLPSAADLQGWIESKAK